MKIQLTNKTYNNQSFGWHIRSHAHMTDVALTNFPILEQYKKSLLFGVQVADISPKLTGIIDNSHKYYGGDWNGHPYESAWGMFNEACYNMNISLALKEIPAIILFKAGTALHFLQDATCPLHTVKSNSNFFTSFIKHLFYEKDAHRLRNEIALHGSKSHKIEDLNFYDNFLSAYKESSNQGVPARSDQNEWRDSINKSYVNGIHRSKIFLNRLNSVVEARRHDNINELLRLISVDVEPLTK